MKPELKFSKKSPCDNCPYRLDAPVGYWDKKEFEGVLAAEESQMGTVYGCHKNDGNVCVGWLMNQHERNLPSINLRIALSRHNVTRKYLDSLHCSSERFESVEEMIEANYPALIT